MPNLEVHKGPEVKAIHTDNCRLKQATSSQWHFKKEDVPFGAQHYWMVCGWATDTLRLHQTGNHSLSWYTQVSHSTIKPVKYIWVLSTMKKTVKDRLLNKSIFLEHWSRCTGKDFLEQGCAIFAVVRLSYCHPLKLLRPSRLQGYMALYVLMHALSTLTARYWFPGGVGGGWLHCNSAARTRIVNATDLLTLWLLISKCCWSSGAFHSCVWLFCQMTPQSGFDRRQARHLSGLTLSCFTVSKWVNTYFVTEVQTACLAWILSLSLSGRCTWRNPTVFLCLWTVKKKSIGPFSLRCTPAWGPQLLYNN